MRNQRIETLGVCLCFLLMVACGGDGTQKSEKLGRIPSLIENEKNEKEALLVELKDLDKSDESGGEKLKQKIDEWEKKYEEQFAAECAALVGLKIPVEVEQGTPVKVVKEFTVKEAEVKKYCKVNFTGEIVTTDDIEISTEKYPKDCGSNIAIVPVGSNGEVFAPITVTGLRDNTFVNEELVKAGKQILVDDNFYVTPDNAAGMQHFEKFVIVNKRTSELYKKAEAEKV